MVKEEWNAAYAEGKRHGSQGTGNNGQKAKKDWGDDFHHYNRGFLEGRNAKAKSLKAVGQGYGKKTNEAEDLEELNKSTIDSYKEKATDELKQAKKYSKSEYGDIAKRIMARRTSGLSRVFKRNESEEDLDESAHPLTQNLPGKSTHITKKDIRHSDGGIVLGSTALRNVEGDKYEIRSGRYRGKVATFHPDNLRKIDEECVSEGIIKKKKPHPEHPYHEKTNAELKQVMNLGDAEKGKVASAILNYRGNWDKAPVRVKESSLEDLHTGKGDGKELKASPEYRRDRRRTAQMLAAQKEVQARVKRGYAEDDKDLDESLDEAHKLGDRVKIVGGVSKDVIGVHGHIGEIRNGAFKGAPKTYTVDYQHPKHSSKNTRSIQLSKEHIRGAKPETLGEGLDEAKMVMPLARHPYHTKSDEELRGIVKDAGETARVQKGMSSEGKYLDQMNDASTVLHYRSKGGKQITATNPRMVAPKSTDDSIKAKLAKWKKNESEEVDEGILSKLIQNKSKPVKAKVAPKAHAKKVAIKPGFYMFSGSVKTADGKDSKVIHYLKNKPLKDKHSLWGMHTPTELAYDPQGFWKIVFNAKQGYHARLTEEQAAGVVAKSRFLGNDAAARSMMELYELCMSWHRGAVAEDRDALLKIDVPPKYRRLPAGALYRGVPITKAQYRALKSGATVTIKAKGTTSSWTSSAKTAKDFSDGEDYSLVIKRTDIKANMLVVNIPDVMFAVTGSKTDAMDFGDEGELVVRNSPQIWTVSPKNVYLLDSSMEAHGVKGSIEEVSTARLKSYAEKAREDAEKLTKQGDRAKTDTTKLSKYVKATKRHLNAHKADDKISSNEFYGKK